MPLASQFSFEEAAYFLDAGRAEEDCDQNKKNLRAGDLEGAENLDGNRPLHKGGSDMDKISAWAAAILSYGCLAQAAETLP